MIAFLKRRWILLSCAVVLSVCSCFDLYYQINQGIVPISEEGSWPWVSRHVGLWMGRIHYYEDYREPPGSEKALVARVNPPQFPLVPKWHQNHESFNVELPIWIPLSVVLSLLVIREKRWREQRAKAADANHLQP